jgi:hypothetical protein
MLPTADRFTPRYQLIILVLLALVLNANTLLNKYALDDIVVLTENRFVEKGVHGIPEILVNDYVSGYSAKENILSGARYRPLSLILFALEFQLFGAKPLVSHLINLLLLMGLVVVLFHLLKSHLFRFQNKYLAFITCLLFVAHPIHTEVIANVKSRDEIMTMILLIGSFLYFLRYKEQGSLWPACISMLLYFLALLTKETAITFIGVFPLLLYYFYHKSVKESLLSMVPFILVLTGYFLLRFLIVGLNHYPVDDVTNSPYLYASAGESFATKVFVLFKYLWVLISPRFLCSDYGYNQIPYIQLNSLQFTGSFILTGGLILIACLTFRERSLISFCIFYFYITLALGTNFIVDLGTPMAERMLFLPSLAFCIALAMLICRAFESYSTLAAFVLGFLLIFYSIRTISRNSDWEDNRSLFLTDVNTSPNSARLNLFASEQYCLLANTETNTAVKNDYLNKAVIFGERSLNIYPKFAYTYLRVGLANYQKGNYLRAADLWQKAHQLNLKDSLTNKWVGMIGSVLVNEGSVLSGRGQRDKAMEYYKKALLVNPADADAWYLMGGELYANHDSVMAEQAWRQVIRLQPEHVLRRTDFVHN